MPHRLPFLRRLGRRGIALALLGSMWCFFGITLIFAPAPYRPDHQLWLWHELIPMPGRALLWIGTGLVAVWYARRRAGDDKHGFAALVAMPLIRTASYTTSGVTWLLTTGRQGYSLALLSALTWAAVATLVMLIAGWPEPPEGERLDKLMRDAEELGRPEGEGE